MLALLVDHEAPLGLRFDRMPRPRPGPGEVLIRNRALSINPGELRRVRSGEDADGAVPGWDTAGTAEQVGNGVARFEIGQRVVARSQAGGWAEFRVVHEDDVALLPNGVSFGQAATLPTAAVTAFLALRRFGSLEGRRVLVTGASGGVGRFAIQLARLGGADVVASVSGGRYIDELMALGADEVVVGAATLAGFVDYAIDLVGGPELFDAFQGLGEGGILLSVGGASGEPTVFPARSLIGGRTRTISAHRAAEHRYGKPLEILLGMVERGDLTVPTKWAGDWSRIGEAIGLLSDRMLGGKAVLTISAEGS